ncbi:LysR family transcriptional regulator [Ferrovibrio sp.]|uniref:LysR family transcriptional regulator n=1 Tax=Ferrovibrio sp. TaxID=1917215 RepID=UPI00345DEC69
MTNTVFYQIDIRNISMTIDLRQIRQFVAVAEELSFRNAAIRLNMSQPPLSTAIRLLEQELGETLLDRNSRSVRLTQVGEVFLREARRTLAQAEHAINLARRTGDGIVGSLRITFVASAALGILPQLVRRFRNQHPEAAISLDSDTTGSQIAALRHGRSDIALVVVPLQDRSGIELIPFRQERMMLAVPHDHWLAKHETVEIGRLTEETFVTFPFSEGPGFESQFLSACQRAGFSPTIRQEVSQMLTKIMLVATGVGIALVPAAFSSVPMPDVVFLPILEHGKPLVYDMAFAMPERHDNPLVKRFLETAAAFALPKAE